MAIVGKLNDYLVFCTVMRNKNITHAAEELHVSQPVVTRAIQNLERDLGCRLLLRTTKGVASTYEGELLYNALQPAFSAVESAEDEIISRKAVSELGIRMAYTDFDSEYVLDMARKRMRKNLPESVFVTVMLNPRSIVRALENGDIDFGMLFDVNHAEQWIRDNIETSIREEKIRKITVQEQEDVIVLGEEFYQEIGDNTTVEELREYPLIVPIDISETAKYYLDILRPDGLLPDDYPVNNMEARLSLTEAGHGLTICPARFARDRLSAHTLFTTQSEIEMLKRESFILVSGRSAPAGTMLVIDVIRHLMN